MSPPVRLLTSAREEMESGLNAETIAAAAALLIDGDAADELRVV